MLFTSKCKVHVVICMSIAVFAPMALRIKHNPDDKIVEMLGFPNMSIDEEYTSTARAGVDIVEPDDPIEAHHLELLDAVYGMRRGSHQCRGGWAHGPIIIGGLSDSATRGAKYIFHEVLNVKMQTDHIEYSGDDHLMNFAIGKFWTNFVAEVNSQISQDTYSTASTFAHVADDLCKAIKQSWKLAGEPMGLWGFKSPRSILMTPVWNYLFEDEYRFVHVVRDPRANCAQRANKIQYNKVCTTFLDKEQCAHPKGCFHYWAKVNGDVQQLFSNQSAQKRCIYMSMDRLVLPKAEIGSESYRMLKQELLKLNNSDGGKTITVDDPTILKILKLEHNFQNYFEPSAFTDHMSLKKSLKETAEGSAYFRQAMYSLGYNIDDWGIIADYESGLVGRGIAANDSTNISKN